MIRVHGSLRRSCLRSFSTLRSTGEVKGCRSVARKQQIRPFSSPDWSPTSNDIRDFSSSMESLDYDKDVDCKALLAEDGTTVTISFHDETLSIFHAPWLWSNDPSFVHATSGQRLGTPGRYPGIRMTSASIVHSSDVLQTEVPDGVILPFPPPPPGSCHPVGNIYTTSINNDAMAEENDSLVLRVTWEGGDASAVSYYDVEWLDRWRYDEEAIHARRSLKNTMTLCAGGRIPTLDYKDLEQGDEEEFAFQLLTAIFQTGAGLVRNAPDPGSNDDSSSPVAILGRLLAGSLSHGALYGDIFHVQSTANANNIANTAEALGPHQDLAYYESKPGLQLLHCVSNESVQGGESVLIDAIAAAEAFQEIAPTHFDTLTKCPATFVKQREGADMMYRRPHICVDDLGDVVSVHWSPPFEGPLSVHPDMVVPYYNAYAAFERMLDNSISTEDDGAELAESLGSYADKFTWERRLEEGDILIFNNLRMLHARRGFSLNGSGSGRHLMGAYTNIDDTLNRYHLLLRDRGSSYEVQKSGNGSFGVR